uniref:Phospholipase A(2) n=1 Tax=Oncorhynchus tshawytscha TaxID=74940 RepID=A0AAZ3PZB5_ONCTS
MGTMEVHDWANPDSWPVLDYANTGCYCGKGSLGTPVNPLDRYAVKTCNLQQ